MSNDLKNKMYDYEVAPSVAMWENISLSLDESALQKDLSKKLYNHETTPPSTAWNKIADELDQTFHSTAFRDEVLDMEIQPPTGTWDSISLQLDEGPQEDFSKKMYEYEVVPPANTWQEIVGVLDAGQTALVIPMRKTYNKIFRIAAAAAIIGIITWAGFSIIKKNEHSSDKEIAGKSNKITTPTVPAIKPNETSSSEEIKKTILLPEDNTAIALTNPVKRNAEKNIKINRNNNPELVNSLTSEENHSTSNDIAYADIKNLHRKNKAVAATDDKTSEARYLVYLTEQGDMVKLSKKLADLTCIYTKDGNVSQTALAKIDVSDCNDQVKYWQGKIANSSFQSSSNPFELMEVLK